MIISLVGMNSPLAFCFLKLSISPCLDLLETIMNFIFPNADTNFCAKVRSNLLLLGSFAIIWAASLPVLGAPASIFGFKAGLVDCNSVSEISAWARAPGPPSGFTNVRFFLTVTVGAGPAGLVSCTGGASSSSVIFCSKSGVMPALAPLTLVSINFLISTGARLNCSSARLLTRVFANLGVVLIAWRISSAG